ncbi:hypothetical protein DL93DRAFT_2072666 [Clavulina sp. PMI_390]|nr:hypothetical protein DL93DRAFT_2072666 [Clavulina sp. PMI_390]
MAWNKLVGAASGVLYLHSRQPPILHGDLHPGIILIDKSGKPKLWDLGSDIHHQVTRTHIMDSNAAIFAS